MRYDPETLYALLPAFHRIRDSAQGEPLKELLRLIAEQLAALEEDIDQSYANLFIETCAEWAVPYLGDLVGYRLLHGSEGALRSSRAEVANTIAFRRRKGTAAVLEELARNLTGLDAAAVEFFLRLATNQHLNHLRQEHHATVDLRAMEPLERLGTAFDRVPHTADVRRIASGRGRHNIPNLGIFLWRLGSHAWTSVRARPAVAGDARRFLFHPLGVNLPLFTLPLPEPDLAHLANPGNVALRLSRRELRRRTSDYYGADRSFWIVRRIALAPGDPGSDLVGVPLADIESCDLSDLDADPDTSTWPPGQAGRVNVDPELGRIRFPADETEIFVIFHHGFSAQLGGGEYGRLDTFAAQSDVQTPYPGAQPTLQATIDSQGGIGTVEIEGAGPFAETPVIAVAAAGQLEIRGADQTRPTLVLGGDLVIGGGDSSEVTLNGLLISRGRIVVPAQFNGAPNRLQRLRLVHCTLVPGLSLHRDLEPVSPEAASILIECPDTELEISWSICGGIRAVATAGARLEHSIIDATAPTRTAYAAPPPADAGPGAPLSIESCTIIGRIHTSTLRLVSNSLLVAATETGDGWPAPVIAARRQQGCVRFSHVPWDSIVPRRYRCHPASAAEAAVLRPVFTSLRYGNPGYAQLAAAGCAAALAQGTDDGAEVGAFHHLHHTHRLSDLRTRLNEYLRFGLEAGIFHST